MKLKQFFNNSGLNIQHIFNISDLPDEVIKHIDNNDLENFSQLILIGHLGKEMWQHLPTDSVVDPIDSYSIATVIEYFKQHEPGLDFRILYPSVQPLALQQLGKLAGWHYDSPFRIGINNHWGSWFAYRAVVLANTDYSISKPERFNSPCDECRDKFCINACPAVAITQNELNLRRCIDFRKEKNSKCEHTCLARSACPIGEEYRYTDEQMGYHYTVSLKTIRKLY